MNYEKTPLLLKTTTYKSITEIELSKHTTLHVERPVYQINELNAVSTYEYTPTTIKQKVKRRISKCHPITCLLHTIPILQWLPRYQWKKNALGDILSGITVAIMHIPQLLVYTHKTDRQINLKIDAIILCSTLAAAKIRWGVRGSCQCNPITRQNGPIRIVDVNTHWCTSDVFLATSFGEMEGMAYGMLGNLPPVTGIYMAFFPVLAYVLFGTSRHVSMGSFAIVCLMTGNIVSEYTSEFVPNETGNLSANENTEYYTSVQVATTVTFTVAIFQILMYIFRLGILTTLLSETLVNSFTCACAFYVVASQMKDLLGLHVAVTKGYFGIIYTVYHTLMALPQANLAAITVSSCFIIIMVFNNELFKPWLAKRTKVPFPIELVAVTVGTAISYCFSFNEVYGISIVGDIPTGLPVPGIPAFSLIPNVALDAFVIAMISYTITMSMALILAQKQHYEVDANQELFALSLSNCVGSIFSCMPIAASLSRSMIQQTLGGVTQLASVVSCTILLVILLWIGPLFENLPRCVLTSIIMVTLKNMLLQITSLKMYWNLSKWDALVWLITFITTVCIGIDIGLLVGILISLLTIFVPGYQPYSCLLGVLPNTDLYLDNERYKGTEQVPGIRIFHYAGSLSFASKSSYRSLLFERIGFNPLEVLTERLELQNEYNSSFKEPLAKYIILDFAALTYIDHSGVGMLRQLIRNFNELDILVYISRSSGPVFETLQRCDKYENKDGNFIIFPTIHDAVIFAQTVTFKGEINDNEYYIA